MLIESIFNAFPIVFEIETDENFEIITRDKSIAIQTNRNTVIVYLTTTNITNSTIDYYICSSERKLKIVDCINEDTEVSLLYLSEEQIYNTKFKKSSNRLIHFDNQAGNIIAPNYKFLNLWKLKSETKIDCIAVLSDFKVVTFNITTSRNITDVKNITEITNHEWLKKRCPSFLFDFHITALHIKYPSFFLSLVFQKETNKFLGSKNGNIQKGNSIRFLNSFELSFEGKELFVKKNNKQEHKCLYFRSDILAVRLVKNFIIILTRFELLYIKNSDLIKFFNCKEESEGYIWSKLAYLEEKIDKLKYEINKEDEFIKNNYNID